MFRKSHNSQISIQDFRVPFGGTLDPKTAVRSSPLSCLGKIRKKHMLLSSPSPAEVVFAPLSHVEDPQMLNHPTGVRRAEKQLLGWPPHARRPGG